MVQRTIIRRLLIIQNSDILLLQSSLLNYASRIASYLSDKLSIVDDLLQVTGHLLYLKANENRYRQRNSSGDSDDFEDNSDRKNQKSGDSGSQNNDNSVFIFDEQTAINILQESIEHQPSTNFAMFGSEFASSLIDFLKLILENYNDIHQVLKLKNFPDVYNILEGRAKQGFGKLIIKNIVDCNTSISDPDEADRELFGNDVISVMKI